LSWDNLKYTGPVIILSLLVIRFLLRDSAFILLRDLFFYIAFAFGFGVLYLILFFDLCNRIHP